jgi:hypothetical protein
LTGSRSWRLCKTHEKLFQILQSDRERERGKEGSCPRNKRGKGGEEGNLDGGDIGSGIGVVSLADMNTERRTGVDAVLRTTLGDGVVHSLEEFGWFSS